jgi:hypothetical protein
MESMKSADGVFVLWLCAFLASVPCESSPPPHPSQTVFVDCKNSMECCIKKFPTTAEQSCGASAADIAKVLTAAEVLQEASKTATLKGVDVPERGEERDDGEERSDWREYCVDQYTRCVDLSWTGNCSNCLDRCKGQRGKWPQDLCSAPKSTRRR